MEKSNLERLVMSPEYQDFVFKEIQKKYPGVKSNLIFGLTIALFTTVLPMGLPVNKDLSTALHAVADIIEMIEMASETEKGIKNES